MTAVSIGYELAAERAQEHLAAARERSAQAGRRRFESIVRRHHGRLRRVAAGVLAGGDGLDDVLQEAYLKAFRNLPESFANEAHEAAWLYRVVYRTCLDELRRRRRRRESDAGLDALAAPEEDAADALAVAAALRLLSPEDRAVLLLVDFAGFDYETAAATLCVPRGTVASRLNAARARFRKALGPDDV
jgi:RNA polymerase sigma-70 factor (ECF subfamily)